MDWWKRRSAQRAAEYAEREQRMAAERAEREQREAAELAAREEAERQRQEMERAYWAEIVDDRGVVAWQRDGTINVKATGPAEIKLAIKELRLKKRELTASKRELQAEIAAIRAEYRTKVAGRYTTRGLTGTSGKIIRAGIQQKRRNERMGVEEQVVPIEQQRNEIDRQMIMIDRAIAQIDVSMYRAE